MNLCNGLMQTCVYVIETTAYPCNVNVDMKDIGHKKRRNSPIRIVLSYPSETRESRFTDYRLIKYKSCFNCELYSTSLLTLFFMVCILLKSAYKARLL